MAWWTKCARLFVVMMMVLVPAGLMGCSSGSSVGVDAATEALPDTGHTVPKVDSGHTGTPDSHVGAPDTHVGTPDVPVVPPTLTSVTVTGAATLADMPYVEGQYTTQPSAAAISDAANYKLSTYAYIAPTNLTAIKTQLAEGLPVILAIKVYYNFFNLGSNKIYTATSGAYQGGHAIAIVGTRGHVEEARRVAHGGGDDRKARRHAFQHYVCQALGM